MPEQNSNGYLIVKVSSANGAIPIENAVVIVQGKDDNNQNILISLITDRDGLTPLINLPSPNAELSESPSPTNQPYSLYNIDVFKEGYVPLYFNSVPVFPSVISVQPAVMVPSDSLSGQGREINRDSSGGSALE